MDNARGGRPAAILANLTPTCRRYDVDPQLYLTQLLANLSVARIVDLPDCCLIAGKPRRKHGSPPCRIKLRTLDPACSSRNAEKSDMPEQHRDL